MTDLLLCKFFERGTGVTLTPRGDTFACESASGTETLNMVGNGKVIIPAYENMVRTSLERVQNGDICVCWTYAPLGEDARPLLVCTFIVDTRQYKNHRYEISGPDLLGELQEYPAISPIGQLTEVVGTALSLGTRTVNHPDPTPDTYEVLEAAYPPRAYVTADITQSSPESPQDHVVFTTATTLQETDACTITFEDGELFETTVAAVSDRMFSVELTDPLPQDLPAGHKVYFYSTRLKVSDAGVFDAGGQLFYTPAPDTDKLPDGNFTIDRIEETADGDYVFSVDPITDTILANSGVTQFQYAAPTTSDVYFLLYRSTFDEWSLIRSDDATTGTAYAPNGETVWDVLLAITDISGYKFRRYFRGWEAGETEFFPLRRLEYFPVALPVVDGEVETLGVTGDMATNYGEILSLETEDTNAVVSHLIPYGGGGGSGRFDFRNAAIGTVLEDYPTIDWGIINGHYYIFNTELNDSHAVWASETFGQISPINPNLQSSRREAADQLLRAACDWLLEREITEVTYNVEIFTIGEPRVGDVIDITYSGADPLPITATNLTVSEVSHEVTGVSGLRTTRLVLNAKGEHRHGGPAATAKAILDLQRQLRQANFGASGDAQVLFDRVAFGGDGTIQSQTGTMSVRSLEGDVNLISDAGEINLDGPRINSTGPVYVNGLVRTKDGLVMPDTAAAGDWIVTIETVRGIPRPKLTYRTRAA